MIPALLFAKFMYALRALDIAARDAESNPASADAAYWLARTNDHLGNYAEALSHYQRAYELAPDSPRYKNALERSKRYLASQDEKQ